MKKMELKATWPLSMLMNIEHRRLVKYEKEMIDLFDNHIIISEQDKNLLQLDALIHPDLQFVIPGGIAIDKKSYIIHTAFFENQI